MEDPLSHPHDVDSWKMGFSEEQQLLENKDGFFVINYRAELPNGMKAAPAEMHVREDDMDADEVAAYALFSVKTGAARWPILEQEYKVTTVHPLRALVLVSI